ncbi:MAG: ATP-binding cassette domain-containing protein, partial [Oscillospiraceae bacterium]|nr:ATP-binding cassette domain-containing protein [Oscillospiraceae bacterium]
MIEIKDLTKRFDGFTALQELNMTVPQASVYGLVGPNGAGKSTIIRHVTGIYYPDSGTVLVGGQPVFENPAVKSRIACIPDDLSCHAGSTIRELRQFYKGLYPNFSDARF